MPRFDVGVEGRFRVNGIEASSGEAARALVLKQLNELFTASVKLQRCWYQPSADTPTASPSVQNS
jgi:hypothetical protein